MSFSVDTNLGFLTLEGHGRQTNDSRSTSGVPLKSHGYGGSNGLCGRSVVDWRDGPSHRIVWLMVDNHRNTIGTRWLRDPNHRKTIEHDGCPHRPSKNCDGVFWPYIMKQILLKKQVIFIQLLDSRPTSLREPVKYSKIWPSLQSTPQSHHQNLTSY